MERCSFQRTPPLICPKPSKPAKPFSQFSLSSPKPYQKSLFYPSPEPSHLHLHLHLHLHATLRSPRGFGAPKKKAKKKTKSPKTPQEDDDEEDYDDDDDENQGIIPEIVTNRMISRMALSVGIPLFIGLAFFPFFYYLKVGLKIDVPTWVPFIVSFFFFGSALLGVSYGIVSSSWDPMREGSLLGWNEAQKNWPVFWQSLWGGGRKNKQ